MIRFRRSFTAAAAFLAGVPAAQATIIALDDFYTPTTVDFVVPSPGVLANDSTSAGTLIVASVNAAGLTGTLLQRTDGSFGFTPTSGASGITSYTYTVGNGLGEFATATVRIDLSATLPRANPDTYVLTTPTLVIGGPGVLANDTGGLGDLRVISVSTAGLAGTLFQQINGGLGFTPSPGLSTTTSYTYTISDGAGRTSTSTVTIDASTNLPVANPDFFTPSAPNFSVAADGVLANDTGGIGFRRVASVSVIGLTGSLVMRVDGSFTYSALGTATDQTFSYTMIDEVGRASTTTVTLDLDSTLPVATSDVYDVTPGILIDVAAAGVLGNDGGGLGALQVASVDIVGLRGTLIQRIDGSFRYIPEPGFTGITSYRYTMTDAAGRFDSATVLLRVGVSDPPPPPPSDVPAPASAPLLLGALLALRSMRGRKIHPRTS